VTAAEHARVDVLRQRVEAAEKAAAAALRDVAALRDENEIFARHIERMLRLVARLSARVDSLEGRPPVAVTVLDRELVSIKRDAA